MKLLCSMQLRFWAVAFVSLSTACAALKPPPREVRTTGYLVGSTPSGATVKVDGVEKGVTPVILQMPMNKGFEVELALAGYQPFTEKVDSKPDRDRLRGEMAASVLAHSANMALSLATGVGPLLTGGGRGDGKPSLKFVPSHTLVTLVPLPPAEQPSKVEKAP